jgi:hypothetical protein
MSDIDRTRMIPLHIADQAVAACDAEIAKLRDENARLKTEVEHLMVFCNCTLIPNKELQAKVERLTKAGDAMVDMVDWEVPYERRKKLEADWNAAKEGKPCA